MKTAPGYELSLHNHVYIQKNLSQLHLPVIPLTVPTSEEKILINSAELCLPRSIVVETEDASSVLTVKRNDEYPIQVNQADERRDTYSQDLFHDPLDYLVLSSTEKFTWHVNTTQDNIKDTEMLREFIGILSTFALGKQLKLATN